jgi:hypothetical protein
MSPDVNLKDSFSHKKSIMARKEGQRSLEASGIEISGKDIYNVRYNRMRH